MTQEFFKNQISRLKERFSDRAFDNQFVMLIWADCHDMAESAFKRSCDVFIGSRSPNKPPLLSEFREARLAEEKTKFENDLKGASNFLKRKAPDEMRKHLRAILSKEFGGVESVKDALDVARHRLRVKAADEPEGAA